MSEAHSEALRALLRRVDEVRGMSDRAAGSSVVGLDGGETLLRTLSELVEELERSHRRLIETNVQLVSLREVAGSLTNTVDTAETTRTVTRYLRRAFGFDQVGLLLIDRERGVLTGAWTGGEAGGADRSDTLEFPLVGERKYARGKDSPVRFRSRRVALHAWRLAFTSPGTGREVEVEAPLLVDLVELLEQVRAARGPDGRDRARGD